MRLLEIGDISVLREVVLAMVMFGMMKLAAVAHLLCHIQMCRQVIENLLRNFNRIGEAGKRPFYIATMLHQYSSCDDDVNHRVSIIMSKFYRWI